MAFCGMVEYIKKELCRIWKQETFHDIILRKMGKPKETEINFTKML